MRFNESLLPEGYRIQVVHLHPGNTSGNQLKKYGKTNAKYVTICKLFDEHKDAWNTVPIAIGVAACSRKDNPSRQLGRQIAVGRAMQQAGIHTL